MKPRLIYRRDEIGPHFHERHPALTLYALTALLCIAVALGAIAPTLANASETDGMSGPQLIAFLRGEKSVESEVSHHVIAPVRLADDGRALEVASSGCKTWTAIPPDHVVQARKTMVEEARCGGSAYPVIHLQLTETLAKSGLDSGPGGAAPVAYQARRVGRLSFPIKGLGSLGYTDWDWCVDRYLDCQLDCQSGGGGVFGSVDSCLRHCDAVFDACTYDPF